MFVADPVINGFIVHALISASKTFLRYTTVPFVHILIMMAKCKMAFKSTLSPELARLHCRHLQTKTTIADLRIMGEFRKQGRRKVFLMKMALHRVCTSHQTPKLNSLMRVNTSSSVSVDIQKRMEIQYIATPVICGSILNATILGGRTRSQKRSSTIDAWIVDRDVY